MTKTATTLIILDTRYKRKDKTSRVRLRVTYNRKQKYYPTKFILSESDFKKVTGEKPRGDYKKIKHKLDEIEIRAEKIIEKLNPFTFIEFERRFNDPEGKVSVASIYKTYINDLKNAGRAGTVQNYQSSINSLTSFVKKTKGKTDFYFNEVDKQFLEYYENWMLQNGKSENTVGMYLRPLRVIFNQAISKNIVDKSDYPFHKDIYQIPSGENFKKALTLKDIEKIYNYETIPGSPEDKAKDFWIFSYLCNGISVTDICRLKFKNVDFDEGTITFIRKKTKRSRKRNQKKIVAIITDEVRKIIEKWGNKPVKSDNYLFPFLSSEDDPEIQFKRVRQATKTINKYMKRIGESLELKIPVTTYTARHSYSTVLKRSGVSVEFISESLGHTSLETTENYLDSFEKDSKKEATQHLLNFKKNK